MKLVTAVLSLIVLASNFGASSQKNNLQEAEEIAQDVYGNLFVTCRGDAYAILTTRKELYNASKERSNRTVTSVYQYKGVVNIEVRPGRLSQVDPMNGVEFRGRIHLTIKLLRRFDLHNKTWTDWEQGMGNDLYALSDSMYIQKRNGQWTRGDYLGMQIKDFLMNPTCAEVDRALSGEKNLSTGPPLPDKNSNPPDSAKRNDPVLLTILKALENDMRDSLVDKKAFPGKDSITTISPVVPFVRCTIHFVIKQEHIANNNLEHGFTNYHALPLIKLDPESVTDFQFHDFQFVHIPALKGETIKVVQTLLTGNRSVTEVQSDSILITVRDKEKAMRIKGNFREAIRRCRTHPS